MTTIASTTLSPAEQDLSAIKTGEWGMREFPLGPRDHPTRRQVIFKQSVLNDIYAHGRGAPDIEVCGVLVGNVYHDAMGPFVFVEANIRGNFSSGKAAQVTFTAKTWAHIQDVMDKEYPDLRILGWYHTHPGHGIFLSDMDLFIHRNFFSLPWHLAFVFDPHNQEEGLFAWRTGNMLIESFVVQKDAPPAQPRVARRVPEFPPNTLGMPAQQQQQHASHGSQAPTHAMHAGHDPHAPQAIPAIPPPAPLSQPALHPSTLTATPEFESSEVAASAPAINAARTMPPPHSYAAAIAGPRATQFAEVTELALRIQTLEKRQRWYTVAMALIVLVAIAWPVVFSALAVLNAPDEPLPSHPSSSATSGRQSDPVQEAAAVHAASVETDPEARP
jgi:proteasome lid subunit RPN8/RPN11